MAYITCEHGEEWCELLCRCGHYCGDHFIAGEPRMCALPIKCDCVGFEEEE